MWQIVDASLASDVHVNSSEVQVERQMSPEDMSPVTPPPRILHLDTPIWNLLNILEVNTIRKSLEFVYLCCLEIIDVKCW